MLDLLWKRLQVKTWVEIIETTVSNLIHKIGDTYQGLKDLLASHFDIKVGEDTTIGLRMLKII